MKGGLGRGYAWLHEKARRGKMHKRAKFWPRLASIDQSAGCSIAPGGSPEMSFDRLHAPMNSTGTGTSPLVEARFIPRQYEPNYAYPLLVLLHGRGGDEEQLVRACRPFPGATTWGWDCVDTSRLPSATVLWALGGVASSSSPIADGRGAARAHGSRDRQAGAA